MKKTLATIAFCVTGSAASAFDFNTNSIVRTCGVDGMSYITKIAPLLYNLGAVNADFSVHSCILNDGAFVYLGDKNIVYDNAKHVVVLGGIGIKQRCFNTKGGFEEFPVHAQYDTCFY